MPKVARISAKNLTVGVFIDDLCALKLMVEAVQFGSPLLIPNFRALMAEAAHFNYMQACVPICKASRASMFAGQTPLKTRVWNNEADDAVQYDFTKSWVAQFKALGQVDGIGKLTHEPDPQQAIIDACYTRMHLIIKNAAKAISITSQSGITGTANQVFTNVRLVPKTTADSKADPAYCTVTLNGAGNAIASVALTEKRATDATTHIVDAAPRFESGTSGARLTVGDTLQIEGLDYSPVTGEFAMPAARLVVTVTELTTFFYYEDEGPLEYGTFTKASTVQKGDNLITEYADTVFARLESEDDLSRRLVLLGLKGPHTPLVPDQVYLDMHPLGSITIPTGYDEPSPFMERYLQEYAATELYDAGKLQEFARYYLASVEEVDARIGEIIASLKAHGLWDRTNFFLWSDHSYAIGNQNSSTLQEGIHKKFQNFGTATASEFILRDPAYPAAVEITEPVSAIDIGPTMLEMAGIPIPAYMEGQSLLPAIRSPGSWRNDRAVISFCFGNLTAVKMASTPFGRRPCRLVKLFNNEVLLYRDDIDPLNKTSLANRPDHAAALAEMQIGMDTELTRIGLTTTSGSGNGLYMDFDGGMLDGGLGDDTYIIGAPATITDTGGNDQMVVQLGDQHTTTFTVSPGIEKTFFDPTLDPLAVTLPDTGAGIVGRFTTVTGGSGNDTIEQSGSGDGGLSADGHGGDDYIKGTPNQKDTLSGGAGNDTLKGSSGNDILDGGGGDNRLGGGADDDSITGSTGNDSIFGGGGKDSIYGGGGIDSLQGDSGNDLIYAGAGNDSVYGGQGGDTLYGEGGDDVMKPGAGTNVLYGGTGANLFEIGFLTGSTTIADWSAGSGNKVRFIPGIGFGAAGASGASILTTFLANSADVGADCVLTIPGSSVTITFTGKLKASFTAADFEVAVFEEIDTDDDTESGGNN